jgi:predicted porin
MMKKSLVALAALAVVGAASAQSTVTLSGKFAFAYEGQSVGGVSSTGFGVTDGNVTFSASEDLGGGMKAGTIMDIRVRGREGGATGSVAGRNAQVYLTGGFGTIAGGAVESPNGILALGSGGAPILGLDGTALGASRNALDAAQNADILQYSSPVIGGGFVIKASLADSIVSQSNPLTASTGVVAAAAQPGAFGMQSTATTLDATNIGVDYNSGPIAASFDYTKFGANAVAPVYVDNRVRLSGTYDFGVVKLGMGYQTRTAKSTVGAADIGNKQYTLGVSAPVSSAVTVGAMYVRNTQDAANAITAWDMGVQYNLSKRTALLVAYQRVSEETAAFVGSKYRVRLMHQF